MKPERLTSTIVIGVLLSVALLFAILLATLNVSATIDAMGQQVSESASESSEPVGTAIGGTIAVAFGALGIILLAIMLVLIAFVPCAILLPFSIRNRVSSSKPIRVINYVYDGVIGAIMLFCILKVILMFAHVA